MFSIGARSDANPTSRQGHIWFSPIIPRPAKRFSKPTEYSPRPPRIWISPSHLQPAHLLLGARLHLSFWISRSRTMSKPIRKIAPRSKKSCRSQPNMAGANTAPHPRHQASVMATYSFNNQRAAAFPRDGERRNRSQRNSFRRPVWYLAQASAREARHEDSAGSQPRRFCSRAEHIRRRRRQGMGIHQRRRSRPLSRLVFSLLARAEDSVPSAAVAPDAVEQVQAIVRSPTNTKSLSGRSRPVRIWRTADRRRAFPAA